MESGHCGPCEAAGCGACVRMIVCMGGKGASSPGNGAQSPFRPTKLAWAHTTTAQYRPAMVAWAWVPPCHLQLPSRLIKVARAQKAA
eukprot:361505-Chlamydomonas_euryale.AAC.6